jgi:uncharacterized protein HemY
VEAERGAFDAADRHFARAYEAAVGTKDMPMLAAVAVAAATVAAARGERSQAAGLLAAATAIRGSEDPTNPEITRLELSGAEVPTREAGLAALEAAASRTAPVGP